MNGLPTSSPPSDANLDGAIAAPRRPRTLAPLPWSPWALVSYLAVGVFWGTSGPAIRFTSFHVAPLWIVVLRFSIAGLILWVALTLAGRRPPLHGVRSLLPSSVALAASNILVTLGFNRVESGPGTLLLATTAVTFAVVDTVWPGGSSKPGARVWAGLLLGLAGVAVLVLGPRGNGASHWSGYAMLAASGWTWAISTVAQARRPSLLDPLQNAAWQMLTAAALTLPLALLLRQPFPTHVPQEALASLAFLIVTASLIGFVCFVHMLKYIPAYLAGSYTYLNSLVAAVTGYLWLGERLTVRFTVAAALVIASVAVIQSRDFRKPRSALS